MKLSGPQERDTETRLTIKQEQFMQGLLEHKDMVRAFTDAYNTGNLRKAGVLSKASELMDNPLIQKRFRELTGSDSTPMYHRLMGRLVLEGLKNEAFDKSNPPNVRVRALETLGKTNAIGLFSEQTGDKSEQKVKADDLEQLLLAKLTALMEKQGLSH